MTNKGFGTKSLRLKLIIWFTILSLLPLFSYAYYSITKSQYMLGEQFQSQTQQMLETNLQDVLKAQLDVMVELSHNPIVSAMDYQQSEPYFKRFVQDNPQYSHILICDPEGTEIAHSEGAEHHGKNIADKEYFKVAWETGQPVISDATFSTSTGRKIVGLGVPIFNAKEEKVGVVVGFIHLEYISERIFSKKVTEHGYTFMLNKKGDFIAHPNKDKLLKENISQNKSITPECKEVIQKMIKQQSGTNEIVLDGQRMIINYKPAAINGWSIAMVSPVQEVYALADKLKKDTIKVILITLVIVLVVVLIISNRIISPLKGYVQLVREKNFTKEFESKDELGEAIARLTKELRILFKNINEDTENLTNVSDQFKNLSENSASAINEMARKVQVIAESAISQQEKVNQLVMFLNHLDVNLNTMNKNLINTKEHSEVAYKTAQEGQRLVEQMALSIDTLNTKTNRVNNIVEVIKGIAEQTNLLALNAAIEAARAGEQGRGFAVVADEVRKLASQSADATNEINGLLEDIKNDMGEVVRIAIDHGEGKNVVSSFKAILEKTKMATDRVMEVASNAKEIKQECEQANYQIEEIKDLVTSTTENVENVAAFTQEQAASIEELSGSADEVHQVTQNMRGQITQYKF